jgi:hypothetical protein
MLKVAGCRFFALAGQPATFNLQPATCNLEQQAQDSRLGCGYAALNASVVAVT